MTSRAEAEGPGEAARRHGPVLGEELPRPGGCLGARPRRPRPRTLPPRLGPGPGPARGLGLRHRAGSREREGRPGSSFRRGAATPPTRGGGAAQALTGGRSLQFARVGAVGVGMFYGFTKLQVLRLTTPSKKH